MDNSTFASRKVNEKDSDRRRLSDMRRMVAASFRTSTMFSLWKPGNGLEAIETLAREHPSLMILDLNMPDMHGLEVLQFVRAHHEYRSGTDHRVDDSIRRRHPPGRVKFRSFSVHDKTIRTDGPARTGGRGCWAEMTGGREFFDQFLGDFYAESEEHLTSARNRMLELESAE
jgi:hypothetical protein